ncbi:MAG: cell division protein FtsA [Candidatus Hydrogenedentota bacterium]
MLIAQQDTDGAVQVIGHGSCPTQGSVSQGLIQDRNGAQLALKKALTAAQKEARLKVNTLFCGVNGKNVETFIREGHAEIQREVVEYANMAEARDIASRDILAPGKIITSSIDAQEWYVDNMRVLDPMGIRGQVLKTRVHFARLPSVIEDNIVSCIESLGCDLEDFVFLPLASAMGCLTPEDMELGVAVLDLGRSVTGLAVYRDFRILNSHCFEWGAFQITRDVAAGLQVSFDEADELILEYGISEANIREEFENTLEASNASDRSDSRIKLKTAVPGAPNVVDRAELDDIVYERAKELLIKVRQHLESRGLSKNLIRGIVLTGGGSMLRNYLSLAESVFQVPCRSGLPASLETMPPRVAAPDYTAAVGIVRHAIEHRRAARNGSIGSRGPVGSMSRRIGRFVKRYFF